MKPISQLLTAGLFLLAVQVFGQPLTTNFVVVPQPGQPPYPAGSHIVVDVKVTSFTNIEGMQFPITFNKDVLRFDSLTNVTIPFFTAAHYYYPFPPAAPTGKISVSWSANLDPLMGGNPNGVTLPANTAMFRLHFTGLVDGQSTINIAAGIQPLLEVIRHNEGPIQVNYQSGGASVTIGTGVAPPPSYTGFKIIANTLYTPQGERGCMPIRVNDFDNIVAFQYAMHWDPAVLQYDCIRSHGLPQNGLGIGFGGTPATGTQTVAWEDQLTPVTGVTMPDFASIYEVCFTHIGAPGAQTLITFDGVGFPQGSGADANNASGASVWTNVGHPNGASGVSAPVYVMAVPPPVDALSFTAIGDTAAADAQACIGIRVKNFTNVTTAEFTLSFDDTKLTYVAPIQLGTNPLGLTNQVTYTAGANDQIKFKYSSVNGITLLDDLTIFSVCLQVKTGVPNGTTTNVSFGSSLCPAPTAIGVARKNVGGVPIATTAGTILVQSTNGITLTPVHISCNGGSNGSISTSTTGPAPISYVWAGPGINAGNQGQANPTGLTAGAYSVTVTQTGGITSTGSTTVNQPAVLTLGSSTPTPVSCSGYLDGTIAIVPTGGTAPYTYDWSHDGPDAVDNDPQTLSGVAAGAYTVTLTDANQCQFSSAPITITSPTAVSLPSPNVVINNVTCTGMNNGSITVVGSGGTPGYTYLWSPGNQTTQTINNLAPATYTVVVTDSKGCSFTAPFTVTQPTPIVPSMIGSNPATCFGSPTGSVNVITSGGTGLLSYCWKNVSGGACVSVFQNPNNLAPGVYNVTVTDGNGCTGTLATNVTIGGPSSPVAITSSSTPSPCFGVPAGTICLNVNGGWGNYTYAWSGGLPPIPCPPGVSPGNYTATVTDMGNCITTHTVNVGGPQTAIIGSAPQIQHVTCFGTGNGGISIAPLSGGNGGPYEVTWTGTTLEGPSIGGLAGGIYQPTVEDVNGCTVVLAPIEITEPSALTLSANVTAANPLGGVDLTVTGGSPNYTYQWTDEGGNPVSTDQDISGMGPGDYTVIVTDANACSFTETYEIEETNLVAQATITSITNECNNDGCIVFDIPAGAVGPFSIAWNGGSTQTGDHAPSICGLSSGPYNVTITDMSNGGTVILPASVLQLQEAKANSTVTPSFDELETGSITLTPDGSIVLTYQWQAPLTSTSNTVTNLDTGTYTVIITNVASGCTSTLSFHVPAFYNALLATSSVQNPVCAGSANGSISLTITGGNDPYTYLWTGPNGFTDTDEDISNLAPGIYTVVVTDANGGHPIVPPGPFNITAQSNLAISNVNELSNHNGWQVSGENKCDGVASVAFAGGSGITSILWSNGATTSNTNTLCGGAYSVTVTDQLGCTSVWSDELTVPPAVGVSSESAGVSCFGMCNGIAQVFVEGGVEPYSVKWSTGQNDPLVFQNTFSQAVNLCGGDYTVTITDDNNVVKTFTITVPEPAEIVVEFSSITPESFNSCDGELLVNADAAVQPVTYTWSGSFPGHSGNEQRADGLCAGEVVSFILTDANGCTATAVDTVEFPEDGCYQVRPVITPGEQDGNNDYVYITCIEDVPNTMEIFNRWGQLVFQTDAYSNDFNDPSNTWTGLTKNGQPLAEGVYYYVLTIVNDQGLEVQFKGHINLLR